MGASVLEVDLGKKSCSVVDLDSTGKVVVRRRMRRATVITYAATLPACIKAMEACCSAHHMGRALARHRHVLRLMSPEYVRPYVKAQKNNDRDPEAIAEAAAGPAMRFVELKTEEQLDMQTLQRIRDQLIGNRTSLMNQIRSLLLEPVTSCKAKLAVRTGEMLNGDEPVLNPRIPRLVSDMRLRETALDERITDLDAEFTDAARADERTRRLLSIPGIGARNATALLAAVGDARTFARGRDLAERRAPSCSDFCPTAPTLTRSSRHSPSSRRTCAKPPSAPSSASGTPFVASSTSKRRRRAPTTLLRPTTMQTDQKPL